MDSVPGSIHTSARLLLSGAGAFLFVFSALFLHHVLIRSPWFAVENIDVIGARKIHVKDAIVLSGLRPGNNIFTSDIRTAARRIAAHPWVQEVRVRRSLPDAIEILVNEWEPAALLSVGSRTMYVDVQGRAFNGMGRIDGLPHITATRGGEGLLGKGVDGLRFLEDGFQEVLLDGVDGVTLVGGDGRTIHMGKNDFEVKNKRVQKIVDCLGRRNLAYKAIDVDFTVRAFVRVKTP